MDFVDLLKRPEGKTLEFKRDLSSPDGVLRSIVAFANTAGGTLLLGVEDKTRHVRGVQNPLAMEVLEGKFVEGDHVLVTRGADDTLAFERAPAREEAAATA